MTNVEENKVLTVKEVQQNEHISYRTLLRHLGQLGDKTILYDKYRVYKVGRQWRFEWILQAA